MTSGTRALSSRRAAASSGRPRCTSISSASAPSTCRSVRASGTASAAPNEPGLPSQFTNVPAFSAAAATGSTTSARSVTALTRSSRLTTNRRGLERVQRRRRVGQVARVHAGDDQRVEVPRRRGGQDLRRVPAGLAGQRGHPPGPRDLGPRGLVGDRPAAGQEIGQRAGLDRAALAGPARYPGQPRAGRLGQPGTPRSARRAPRPAARRPGSPRPAPAAPAPVPRPAAASPGLRRGRHRVGPALAPARSSASASSPGAVGSSTPDIRLSPRLASAASE